MSFRKFLPAALAAAVMLAGVSPAAEPAVIAQMQPVGKTVGLLRGVFERYGGSEGLSGFNKTLEKIAGPKGLTGIDQDRPVLAYMVQTDDPQQPGGVILLPISTKTEFLDLLKRGKVEVGQVKGEEGLYEVIIPDAENVPDKPVRMRVAGTHAYFSVNLPDTQLAADKLVAPEKLAISGPACLLAVRSFFDRFPKNAVAQNAEQMQQVKDLLDGLPIPEELKGNINKLIDSSVAFSERMAKEGEVYDVRLDVDPATDDLTVGVVLKPRAGTELQKQIAAYKSPTNRFAGMLTKDTVLGVFTRLPLFTPEIRDTVSAGLKEAVASQEAQIPEPAKVLADEALAGVIRTVKTGAFDFGLAVTTQGDDGKYSVAVGVSFENPAAVEKELRTQLKNAPEGVENFIKLDAEKVGEVGIHVVTAGGFLPPQGKELFGEDAVLAIAFAPKAIHAAFGKDAVARVKSAVGAKPVPAPVAQVVTNGPKLLKLMETVNPDKLDESAKLMFDKEDAVKTAFRMDIAGGETMTTTMRLRLVPILLAGAKGVKDGAKSKEAVDRQR